MNPLEILLDFLTIAGPPRADRDRSIVGESPLERSASRFWRRLGLTLLLAAGVAAFYVWVIRAG